MKPHTVVLVTILALTGCATSEPRGHGAHGAPAEAGRSGDMMGEMCQHHASEPGRAASAPGSMMDKHCQAQAPAGAASHVH